MNEERRTSEQSRATVADAGQEASGAIRAPETAATAPSFIAHRSSLFIPRVACFTPLSPVGSGISYYSEDLLPVLARALDLTVFVDGYLPTQEAELRAAGVQIRDGREFERAARAEPFAATIYQMGNSPAHAYMYERALRAPGIVVLHDVVLHHLRLWMAVNGGRGKRAAYADELRQIYGAAGEELARAVLRGQTPATLFDYPLVEPLLEAARAVIVHNEASAARVRSLRPGVQVRVVPMGVPLPPLPLRDQARARLGVAPDAFLVVSHGHVNPYKRLDVALRAFRRLLDERPDARFLISGSEAPGLGAALDRQTGYLGLGDRVRRFGFVPPETAADLLAAADCCVNLRYPSAGETSASLLRIMGAGLPVLVSDAGSFSELPDSAAIKVPVGQIEEALLAEYLIELARNETLRASLGAAARSFIAAEHSLERSATGYLDTLSELLGQPLSLPHAPTSQSQHTDVAVEASPQRKRFKFRVPRSAFRVIPVRNRPAPTDVPPLDDTPDDPLLDAVAEALADLRLDRHEPVVHSVARDLVALGLRADAGGGEADKEGRWRPRLRLAGRR